MAYVVKKQARDIPHADARDNMLVERVYEAFKYGRGQNVGIYHYEGDPIIYPHEAVSLANVLAGSSVSAVQGGYHSSWIFIHLMGSDAGIGFIGVCPETDYKYGNDFGPQASAAASTASAEAALAEGFHVYTASVAFTTYSLDRLGWLTAFGEAYRDGGGLAFGFSLDNNAQEWITLAPVSNAMKFVAMMTVRGEFFPFDDYRLIRAHMYGNYGVPFNCTSLGHGYLGGGQTFNTYSHLYGSSMATPQKAGIAAIVKSTNPDLSGLQLESCMEETDTPLWLSYFDYFPNSSGNTNALKSCLKATSLKAGNASKLFPYLNFFSPFADLAVRRYFDHDTNEVIAILPNEPLLVEMKVYGQNWTGSGTVQFWVDDTMLYEGTPTTIAINNSMSQDVVYNTAAHFGTMTLDGVTLDTNIKRSNDASLKFSHSTGAMAVKSATFSADLTNMQTFMYDMKFAGISLRFGEDVWLDTLIGDEVVDTFLWKFVRLSSVPQLWERRAIDVRGYTGNQTITFRMTAYNCQQTCQANIDNILLSSSLPATSGFTWDSVLANEERELRLVATDGALTEEITFHYVPPDLTSPVFSGEGVQAGNILRGNGQAGGIIMQKNGDTWSPN